jgi:ferredoxin
VIVAEQKPIDEIKALIQRYNKVLVVGCDSCVAECAAGGRKEAALLASALSIAFNLEGRQKTIVEDSIDRQCVDRFVHQIAARVPEFDAILSLGCGAGAQFLAQHYPDTPVIPGLNTLFIGTTDAPGRWTENCLGCGDCKLALFGTVCPVARCAKHLFNGPCGGAREDGTCEVNPEMECGWAMILERLERLGEMDRYTEVSPPVDWSTSHAGGVRRVVREDRQP